MTVSKDAPKPEPVRGPDTPAEQVRRAPVVWPIKEPEEEKVPSWGLTILLYVSPFIFLAVLAFVLVLCGAQPN